MKDKICREQKHCTNSQGSSPSMQKKKASLSTCFTGGGTGHSRHGGFTARRPLQAVPVSHRFAKKQP